MRRYQGSSILVLPQGEDAKRLDAIPAEAAATSAKLATITSQLEAAEARLKVAEDLNEAERTASSIAVRPAILDKPWQSLGARGTNNLAAKLLLALLPPTNESARVTPWRPYQTPRS